MDRIGHERRLLAHDVRDTLYRLAMIALLSGCATFLLAQFKVSSLVQHLPFPVIGGCLAGTGWLLVEGSAQIMTGSGLLDLLTSMVGETTVLLHWLPGFAFEIILLAATRRWSHPAIMPAGLIIAVVVFYLISWSAGVELEGVHAEGWLLGPFTHGSLIRLVGFGDLQQVDWTLIVRQAPELATIVIIGVITVSLTVGGLELPSGEEIDLDREFKVLGAAKIVPGLAGGVVGWHSPAQSALAHSVGSDQSRFAVVVSIAAIGIILFAGPPVLTLLPRIVVGGLICYLVLSFVHEWLFRARRRLLAGDSVVVLIILVTIATMGILRGVVIGLAISVVLFVTEYSRTGVIRHVLTGVTRRSNVVRRPENVWNLDENGERVLVLKLQGFLFFGAAHRLLKRVRNHVHFAKGPSLKFLVLDVGLVTDAGSSSLTTFTKLRNFAIQSGFQIICGAPGTKFVSQLKEAGATTNDDRHIHIAKSLDCAMEYCEEILLGDQGEEGVATDLVDKMAMVFVTQGNTERIRAYFTPMEFANSETIIHRGNSADGLYYSQSGRLTVFLELPDGGRRRLSAIREGTIIGEMGLYSAPKNPPRWLPTGCAGYSTCP